MRDEDFFWEGARDGKLLVQKCRQCETLRHPPLPMCAKCQSTDWSAVECTGRGEVLGWVLSTHPTRPDAEVRTVVLVQLEEGVRLISNLQDIELAAIDVGMPVEVFYQTFGETVLPQFRPARTIRR